MSREASLISGGTDDGTEDSPQSLKLESILQRIAALSSLLVYAFRVQNQLAAWLGAQETYCFAGRGVDYSAVAPAVGNRMVESTRL